MATASSVQKLGGILLEFGIVAVIVSSFLLALFAWYMCIKVFRISFNEQSDLVDQRKFSHFDIFASASVPSCS